MPAWAQWFGFVFTIIGCVLGWFCWNAIYFQMYQRILIQITDLRGCLNIMKKMAEPNPTVQGEIIWKQCRNDSIRFIESLHSEGINIPVCKYYINQTSLVYDDLAKNIDVCDTWIRKIKRRADRCKYLSLWLIPDSYALNFKAEQG